MYIQPYVFPLIQSFLPSSTAQFHAPVFPAYCGVLFAVAVDLFDQIQVGVLGAVALAGDPGRIPGRLGVAAQDHRGVLLVQLHEVGDAVGLLGGHQGRTAASEGVEDDRVGLGGVADRIGQQVQRLARRVVGVLSRLGEVPDRGLFPVSEPLVLGSLLPPVEDRFVLPLVRRASQHEGVFDPDAAAGELEPGIDERFAEVQPFGVGVEHISRPTLVENARHVGERGEQELVEGVGLHRVVFDREPVGGLEGHVVGRVGEHQVRACAVHEHPDIVCVGSVPADQPVPADGPDVPALDEGGGLESGGEIEAVIGDLVIVEGTNHRLDFVIVEAGELGIKVGRVQVGDEQGQLGFIPVAADLVQCDVERLLAGLVQFDDHAVNISVAQVGEYFQALVAADDVTGGVVVDHRLDIAELGQRPLEFFVVRIPGLQVLTRVVVGGLELTDG
ncbi:hypothetical protein CIP107532_01810 [Corynebacterium diphtheriae]|nr:hypothetical protein CIP107514_01698 [Corynebacterium diphtheriae]CAB0574269.1 hypothetical protein CIP107532_01810 [Corynebacterium diphtheriae]